MKRPPTRGSRQAPLVQAGLAALVAGSLFMFATIAFRSGFFEDGPSGVRAASTAPQPTRPVVLPAASAEPEVAARRERRPERVRVALPAPDTNDVVVATVDEPNDGSASSPDRHRNKQGIGHDKGKGKGHRKDKDDEPGKGSDDKRPEEAKEEDDEDDDDDDDVRVASDDDDSEGGGRAGSDGGSGSGSGGHGGSGSGHSGGGSSDSND